MKFSTLFAVAGSAALAHGHTTIFNMLVNDVDQGLGNSAAGYIRSPPSNSPVKDLTSQDLTCNVNNSPTAMTVSVKGGDKVTFQWHHESAAPTDDFIDPSHLGPILVYMAPTSSNGAGNVWVKVFEDGYDASTKTWAVTKLIANKGQHSFVLPDLAAGDYLIRGEIIALHEADTSYQANPARGAQFYMECAQVKVTSAGSQTLPGGVAIPGTYTYQDPGVVFNLYAPFTSYPIPGPPVWNGVGGGQPTTTIIASTEPVVTVTETSSFITCVTPTATVTDSNPPVTTITATPVPKYDQCGGIGYVGSTTCADGSTCTEMNPYYFQCV